VLLNFKYFYITFATLLLTFYLLRLDLPSLTSFTFVSPIPYSRALLYSREVKRTGPRAKHD